MSRTSFSRPSRQRGVALVTAILIVALAALMASSMLSRQNITIHRSSNLLMSNQAWWYAVGAENWAGTVLKRDAEDNEYDHLTEPWSQALDFLPVEGGFLSGGLVDLQSRYNLNNLALLEPEEAATQLEILLASIEDVESANAPALAQSIRDWVDADIEVSFPDGAEDDYYLSTDLPYRTPNQPMHSPTELLLVRGVTPEIYRALLPYVTALPPGSAMNVNTASPEVLATISPELTPDIIKAILDARQEAPFENLDDFLQLDALAGIEIRLDDVAVSTQYFLLEAVAQIGKAQATLYSVLRRDSEGKVSVIRRSKDSL